MSENQIAWLVRIVGFVFALLAIVGGILFKIHFRNELAANIITELASIAITVVIIAELNQWRNIQQEKRQLASQMGSTHNEIATDAVRLLKLRGWGFRKDKTLQGVILWKANLQGVKLGGANLQGAYLWGANLQEADLSAVNLLVTDDLQEAGAQPVDLWIGNLQGALPWGANLQKATLRRANLQGADLKGANLEGAGLEGANLEGALLWEANLEGALLFDASFSVSTLLPDGSMWTPDTDMSRFTDPNHSDFWRSDFSGSPAYRGDDANAE